MKRSIFIYIMSILAVASLQGCLKDDLDGQSCPDNLQGSKIALSMGDMQVVETRGTASSNENTITDAYVLVFGSGGTFRVGEKINLTVTGNITGNGTKSPVLKINDIDAVATNETVVVLCNTGVTALPAIPTTATVDDINTYFPSDNWSINQSGADSGKGMPMSGTIKLTSATIPTIPMYRSVAKVQLLLNIPTGQDITSSFTTAPNAVTWGLYNEVQQGNVYSTEYAISTPSSVTFVSGSAMSQRVVGATDATDAQQTRYTPEYPSSTKAKTATVTPASAFHKDRTCLLVHTSAGYYRIDFATGNGNEETKAFLDINRNYHYKVTITKVKSRGYETAAEALANPGSNLEYEIVITGDKDNFTTSNGQYAVTTDKKQIAVTDGISTAEDFVWFSCKANGVANVSTRSIRLVGADKNTVIPVTQLQMRKSDGTAIAGNKLDPFTSSYDAGCQLKFTSPDEASLPTEQCYVEIAYGNIRHYVPVNAYVFEVTPPADYSYTGGSKSYYVTSYKVASPKAVVAWTAKEFSTDGGATWSATKPSWLTSFPDNAVGSTTAKWYSTTIAAQTGSYPHNDILRTSGSVSGTYDLSTKGGSTSMNTANCYIVNKAGKYSLPLVYGNAIKNGVANESAYKANISGANIMSIFTNHLDAKISNPYIYNNAGCVPDHAELVWQDAKDLITVVGLSTDKHSLTFTVTNTDDLCQGNAVIAVCDASNNVLWSWHIWVTDYKLGSDIRKFTNAASKDYYFMPYNIGWCDGMEYSARSVKVRFTQAESGLTRIMDIKQLKTEMFGNNTYFQWGRKDPFVGGSNGDVGKTWYDGSGVENVNTIPALLTPAWTTGSATNVIMKGILNPNVFCANYQMDYYYYNLWNAKNTDYTAKDDVIKTIYDPSPVGYTVPASNAVTGFSADAPSAWDTASKSWAFINGADTVKFSAIGFRNGSSGEVGGIRIAFGYYWLAEPKTLGTAYSLFFSSGTVEAPKNDSRAVGLPVRPVADVE